MVTSLDEKTLFLVGGKDKFYDEYSYTDPDPGFDSIFLIQCFDHQCQIKKSIISLPETRYSMMVAVLPVTMLPRENDYVNKLENYGTMAFLDDYFIQYYYYDLDLETELDFGSKINLNKGLFKIWWRQVFLLFRITVLAYK